MHAYSEASPIVLFYAYSQESMRRIAALCTLTYKSTYILLYVNVLSFGTLK